MSKPAELKNVAVKFISVLTDEKEPSNNAGVIFKSDDNSITIEAKVVKTEKEKGLLYVQPMIAMKADTDNEFYVNETIEKTAHDFLRSGTVNKVDKNHTCEAESDIPIVESYINKSSDAWVWEVTLDISQNDELLEKARNDEITGVSIFGFAEKVVEQSTKKEFGIEKAIHTLTEIISKFSKSKESSEVSVQKDFNSQFNYDTLKRMYWASNDSIWSILNDDSVEDKKTAIKNDLDLFKAAIDSIEEVSKSKALPEERIIELSKAVLDADYKRVCTVLNINKSGEGKMDKKDIEKMIGEAVNPLKTEISDLKKQSVDKDKELADLKKEKKELDEKISELEKETGGSQQGEVELEPVKKEEKRIWT